MCLIADVFQRDRGETMVLNFRNCSGAILLRKKSCDRTSIRILHLSKKHLSNDEACQQKTGVLSQRFYDILKWYDEFTGMDEVRKAQSRVLEEERIFRNAQEIRRNYLVELNEIQAKIKELYAELDTVSRGDDKYISLVTMEHKLLKEEKAILVKFSIAEKDERESFANLSNSVKLSHEKERAQSERTKYWSIIGSILGTIFGIVGTSINNHFKMNELRELIKTTSDKTMVINLKNLLENNEKFLDQLNVFLEAKANNQSSSDNDVKTENLLNIINSRLLHLEEKVKQVVDSRSVENWSSINGGELSDTEEGKAKIFMYAFATISMLALILSKYSS